MAPHSSTLAWKIPWTEEPGRLQFMGSLRVGHDCTTSLSLFTFMHWRRKWQPTPVLLPGESQGRGSLVGCCLWDRTESDVTEATQQQQQQQCAQSSEHGIPQRREGFVVVIQSLSRVLLFATSWTAASQVSVSSTVSWSLLKFMSIESVMASNHLILCHPLLLPSIFPSIRVFSSESVGSSHQVAKALELRLQRQSFQ